MSSSRFAPVQLMACTLSCADHLGERDAELRGDHRAGQRDEHLAALIEVAGPRLGRVLQRRGVEMAIVAIDELRNWA